ncbi:hypothetical protein FACS189430_10300 [Bacteroidia bacterium]|nr:hypothetical protein FACS189430_10300 [Bacteroidia bacterium]
MDKTERTIIGKDVIESLTTSMYDDPRFVYREYIQNSADAIDKARQQKVVENGNIYISIDIAKRKIEIEDDAIGIESSRVVKILKNIAQSTKQKGVDKGFRGIGRLGGLGYCDKLIFETSSNGETEKSIMIWDAKQLKEIIADRTQKQEASAVIEEVTTFKTETENTDKHYFKVVLEGVTNDSLLDVKDIRQYLSMVAPVPFKKSIFSDKIYKELRKENIKLDEYNITVETEQLYKGYNWYIYEGDQNNKKKIGEIFEIEFFNKKDNNGNPLFWGWYGIAEKNETLNKINFARGFRLRKENIQIGNDDTLQKLQKDRRFQFYFFGEVYALNSDLQPNARRDYFSENEVCKEFEEKLKSFFHNIIAPLCQDSSATNSSIKKIETYNNLLAEYQQKEEKGFVSKSEKESIESDIEKKKKEAEDATKKIEKLKLKENSPISKIIERRTSNVNIEVIEPEIEVEPPTKPTFRTDKLSKLEKRDRKFLGEIFSIISNVLTKDLAENLISKIEEKYK